jgi:hypothetical protein
VRARGTPTIEKNKTTDNQSPLLRLCL